MENEAPFLFGLAIGFVAGVVTVMFAIYIRWMSGPAPEDTHGVTGGISAPLPTIDPARHSSDTPDALRNACDTYLFIHSCSDPLMWYADKVGQYVPHLGSWPESGYVSRDSGGYKNVVRFSDAYIVHGHMNRGM